MSSNFISPLVFLTENALEHELFNKLKDIMDYTDCRDTDYSALFDEVNSAYGDLLYKHKDITKLSEEGLRAKIAESGFAPLLELLNYSHQQLIVMAGYLPLIKMFRGTKQGLEIILQIFASRYEITECWEDPENMDDYTFDLSVQLINASANIDVFSRFIEFCRHYVYPILTSLNIDLLYSYQNINVCTRARVQYKITAYCDEED